MGSNPGPYTEYGKNSCDINHRSYRVVLCTLSSKTAFPSCKVVLHCVQYHLDLVVQICPTSSSQSHDHNYCESLFCPCHC